LSSLISSANKALTAYLDVVSDEKVLLVFDESTKNIAEAFGTYSVVPVLGSNPALLINSIF